MINYLRDRARDWPPLVRFMLAWLSVLTVIQFLVYGVTEAAFTVVSGATAVTIMQMVCIPLSEAAFTHWHERTGTPLYCGSDEKTYMTPARWHRAIVALVMVYIVNVVAYSLLEGSSQWDLPLALLTAALAESAWLLGLLAFFMGVERWHFAGHQRRHRKELAAQEAESRARENERRFWGMVHENYRHPGAEGAA